MISEMRRNIAAINGLNQEEIDGEYTFFYDESINIRKFKIKSYTEYNNPIDQDFVLGGLMICAPNQRELPYIGSLIDSLHLQKSMREIKCEHIVGNGDFISSLNSKRLKTLLSWIDEQQFWIHFRSANYFYYGLVDIIDEYINNSDDLSQLILVERIIKNALWKAFREKDAEGRKILYTFNYPNVGQAREAEFYKNVQKLYRSAKTLTHEEVTLLDYIFKEAIQNPCCTFLDMNDDHVIQDGFAEFYTEPVYLFCNSTHIFDEEKTVEPKVKLFCLHPEDIKVHFEFRESKSSYSTQISDVIVGLLGRLFKYADSISSFSSFENDWHRLNTLQKDNFSVISRLIMRSMQLFPALINRIQPISSSIMLEKILGFSMLQG